MTDGMDSLLERLLGVFRAELESRLVAMRTAATELRAKGAGPEPLDRLFREAHTLKSASASVGLEAIERGARFLEGMLAGTRARDGVLTSREAALVDSTLDAIEAAGRAGASEALEALLPRLDGVRESLAATARRRVVLADDSTTTRLVARRTLEAAGYEVVAAVADGAAALAALAQTAADLVVSDVRMPGMGGIDLVRAIRADERWKTLPVVLVTASEGEETRSTGLAAGANAVVVKSGRNRRALVETLAWIV